MADQANKPPADTKSNTTSSTSKSPRSARPYISGGQMLDSPPLTARITSLLDHTYNALGLYVVSLFSLDPYAAAQNSQFNTRGPGRVSNAARARWGSTTTNNNGLGGGAGTGPRGGGGGNGGRRLGTVDDLRGPECGSCG